MSDYREQEFSLISGGVGDYDFDPKQDDIKLTVYNTNDDIVITNGKLSIYDIYQGIFYENSTDNALTYGQNGYYDPFDGNAEHLYSDIPREPLGIEFYEDEAGMDPKDIQIYPNEILKQKLFVSNQYKLKFDFYRNVFNFYFCDNNGDGIKEVVFSNDPTCTPEKNNYGVNPRFIVKTISPSRKEVRLIIRNDADNLVINDIPFDVIFNTIEGSEDNTYSIYNFVLSISRSRDIPIINYIIDDISLEGYSSLILKLNEPLPTDVSVLSQVQINRKVINTSFTNILYYSNIIGEQAQNSLPVDTGFEYISNYQSDDLQNYNQLIGSSSFSNDTKISIQSEISASYPNLNVDFSEFANHAMYSSAVSKLENFKTKVFELEVYSKTISRSLSTSGSAATQLRKDYFDKINKVVNNFTPYEKFLYYDNQYTATSSAPGIGTNLADHVPVTTSESIYSEIFHNYDGFSTVYRHSNANDNTSGQVKLFTEKYKAHECTLYNYSGSVYLSFLLKGDGEISGSDGDGDGSGNLQVDGLKFRNNNTQSEPPLPKKAFGSGSVGLLTPFITASGYARHMYASSQSFWQPAQDGVNIGGDASYWANDDNWTLLTGKDVTGSFVSDYNIPDGYHTFVSRSSNDANFTGSILPMGDLFNNYWENAATDTTITSSYITDVKVTKNTPSESILFTPLYHTTSSKWEDWYNGIYESASVFDRQNIPALQNNIPKQLKESNDSKTLTDFLSLIGEQFDLIRNHVDTYETFTNRGYSNTDSVPDNMLPVLAGSLGWELINPYTADIGQYFSTITSGSNSSIQNVMNSTWRKTINNLIYIYKTKGTIASLQALLNCYGYPPDVLKIKQYNGSLEESNPRIISSKIEDLDKGIKRVTGNNSFISKKILFPTIRVNTTGSISQKIKFDWWTNSASADTLEFIFSSPKTNNTQSLVESSGSTHGTASLWDLRLIPTGSSHQSASLEFRLNTFEHGSGSLNTAGNSVSIKTKPLTLLNNKLWNVMLRRATSSLNSDITQSYELFVGMQDEDKIKNFTAVSMSITSALANVNFMSGGNFNITSSGNLCIGETFSGSLGEFRTWETPLKVTKFKQHILNKLSVVGNTISGGREDLIYRYRFNDNIKSGSSGQLVDGNPNYNGDYSQTFDLLNYGNTFNKIPIIIYRLSVRTDSLEKEEENSIFINPVEKSLSNLNPSHESYLPFGAENKTKRTGNNLIEFSRSPVDRVNDYIIEQMADYRISDYFANPENLFEQDYTELQKLRREVLTGVKVSANKYIEKQKDIFNPFIVNSIKSLFPANSTLDTVGIVLKSDLLERDKIKYYKADIKEGSDAGYYTSSLGYIHEISFDLTGSSKIGINEKSIDIINNVITFTGSFGSGSENLLNEKTFSIVDYINSSSTFNTIYDDSISIYNTGSIVSTGSYLSPYDKNINVISGSYITINSSSILEQREKTVLISNYYTASSEQVSNYTSSFSLINNYITKSGSLLMSGSGINYFENQLLNIPSQSLRTSGSLLLSGSGIDYYENTPYYFVTPETGSAVFKPMYSSSVYIDTDFLSQSAESMLNHTTSIKVDNNINSSSIYQSFNSGDLLVVSHSGDNAIISGSFRDSLSHSIAITSESFNLTGSEYISIYSQSENIYVTGSSLSGSSLELYTASFNMNPEVITENATSSISGTISFPYSASIRETIDNENSYGKPWWKDPYGNDYRILNLGWTGSSDSVNSIGHANTAYYPKEYITYTIGDTEHISGSWLNNEGNIKNAMFYIDYNTNRTFHSRLFIDTASGVQYNSFMDVTGSTLNTYIQGRMVGRTAFYRTASDGTLHYPTNHYINAPTSKNLRNTYEGCTSGEFVTGSDPSHIYSNTPIFEHEGYILDEIPTASFYTINVEGADDDGPTNESNP